MTSESIKESQFRYNIQYNDTGDSQRIEKWLYKNCSFYYGLDIDQPKTVPNSANNIQLRFKNQIYRTKFRKFILNRF